MIKPSIKLIFAALSLSYAALAPAENVIHHDITMTLNPYSSRMDVWDVITIPESLAAEKKIPFRLNYDLRVDDYEPFVKKTANVRGGRRHPHARAKQFEFRLKEPQTTLKVHYAGKIQSHVNKRKNYELAWNRGKSVIDRAGVHLEEASLWYPYIEGYRVTVDLKIKLPHDWVAISQGTLVSTEKQEKKTLFHWRETNPQQNIYLLANRLVQQQQSLSGVDVQWYLRKENPEIIERYKSPTAHYLAQYQQLLGPYPYSKFAVVEHFWESERGLPSIQLFGSKTLEDSSSAENVHAREMLRNWFGNGVYVNYEQGLWSEGLLDYLADHLLDEQQGRGSINRRNLLQRYVDFISLNEDSALEKANNPHKSYDEVIVVNKSAMLFHMLRKRLGDEKFIEFLQQFYERFKYQQAGFDHVEALASKVAAEDLSGWFAQWVKRIGAPSLEIGAGKVEPSDGEYKVSFTLLQNNRGAAYDFKVPLAIFFEDESIAPLMTSLDLSKNRHRFNLSVKQKPAGIILDPMFDVFRLLDPKELPASLTQGFGENRVLTLLPFEGVSGETGALRAMANQWRRKQTGRWSVLLDVDIDQMPSDKSIWLMGLKNRFTEKIIPGLTDQGVMLGDERINIDGQEFDLNEHVVALAVRNPDDERRTVLWLATLNPDLIPPLLDKIPRFKKYSYLVFKGAEGEIVLKGQWDVNQSPMRIVFDKDKQKQVSLKLLPKAQALIMQEQVDPSRFAAAAEPVVAPPAVEPETIEKPVVTQP